VIEQAFLNFSADKLAQLSGRIQDCLGKLTYDQVWLRATENENSVGNLVLHLCGNVGQWIGCGVAGRPDNRERDKEFTARGGLQPAELARRLEAAVSAAAETIRNLDSARLPEMTVIQKYNTTVMEAIYHVVEHFAQHAGQILFATKLLTGQGLGYYKHLNKPAHSETRP